MIDKETRHTTHTQVTKQSRRTILLIVARACTYTRSEKWWQFRLEVEHIYFTHITSHTHIWSCNFQWRLAVAAFFPRAYVYYGFHWSISRSSKLSPTLSIYKHKAAASTDHVCVCCVKKFVFETSKWMRTRAKIKTHSPSHTRTESKKIEIQCSKFPYSFRMRILPMSLNEFHVFFLLTHWIVIDIWVWVVCA